MADICTIETKDGKFDIDISQANLTNVRLLMGISDATAIFLKSQTGNVLFPKQDGSFEVELYCQYRAISPNEQAVVAQTPSTPQTPTVGSFRTPFATRQPTSSGATPIMQRVFRLIKSQGMVSDAFVYEFM